MSAINWLTILQHQFISANYCPISKCCIKTKENSGHQQGLREPKMYSTREESIVTTFVFLPVTTVTPFESYEWMLRGIDVMQKWWPIGQIVVGVFGNVMSLLVTTRKDNRKISTCCFMSGLACVDTMVLLVDACYRVAIFHGLGKGFEENFAFLSIAKFAGNAFGMTSGLFLAEMSLDRAIAVSLPMKAASICTASRATKVISFTFVAMMVCNLQTFFTYEIPDPPNATLIRHIPNARWLEPFLNIGLLIFGTIIPFSVLIVCNIVIIVKVRIAASKRGKMEQKSSKSSAENSMTIMLVMTSFAYLVCSSPLRIYETLPVYNLSEPYWAARYSFEFWVCLVIWHLNFVVNFYIYFLCGGKKFRQDAKKVLLICYN
ncbi:uncharacterized protein LOC135494367 [Lineus longissimus]|uniref:uncharacterized protein LOC135494367 n=1 Tax=Lineus longissimus TaxID=88925 RepID=UPI00315D7122